MEEEEEFQRRKGDTFFGFDRGMLSLVYLFLAI